MGAEMKPCFTVSAERVLWRAEDVVSAGDDGDQDSGDGDHLVCEVEDREDWQQMTVRAETAGVYANGEVKDGDPCNRGHAEPLDR